MSAPHPVSADRLLTRIAALRTEVPVSTSSLSRRGLLLGAALLLVLAATAGGVLNPWRAHAAAIQGDVFVSPSGDDANPRTQSAPGKTPQPAQAPLPGLNRNQRPDAHLAVADGLHRPARP